MGARHGNHPTEEPLVVGVLLVGDGTQLLDVAPVDLLGMMQKSYLKTCELPQEIWEQGIDDIKWHYISEEGVGLHTMTAGVHINATDSLHTCPPLDILILGGPPLDHIPHPDVTEFLTAQLPHLTALLTICAGYLPLLHSGLLAGKTATAPRLLLPGLKAGGQGPGEGEGEAGKVTWVEKRWCKDEVDGKIWTSGAVTNGLDLMVGFMRERFGGQEHRGALEMVFRMADVGMRGQEYGY